MSTGGGTGVISTLMRVAGRFEPGTGRLTKPKHHETDIHKKSKTRYHRGSHPGWRTLLGGVALESHCGVDIRSAGHLLRGIVPHPGSYPYRVDR